MMSMEHDVFISHASEDKEAFVAPFAQLLVNLGLNVWYDEFSLEVGNSLSRSIDKGLAKSKFGIVVLSKDFIAKPWPEYELRGLVSKELGRDKVILPIWHNVSRDDVLEFSPSLADKFALSTDRLSLHKIALKIVQAVRPDIFKNLQLMAWWKRTKTEGKKQTVPISTLKQAPIRHDTFSVPFLIRVKLVAHILADTGIVTFEGLIDGFKRDLTPNEELHIWEKMAAAYIDVVGTVETTHEAKQEVLSVLLALNLGMSVDEIGKQLEHLNYQQAVSIAESFFKIAQQEKEEGSTDSTDK